MASVALVINGVPASGKTTLAHQLQGQLGLPMISRDAIKEALADLVPVRLPTSGVGYVASDTLWGLVGLVDGPVIVESFWLTGRDDEYFTRGLAIGGVQFGIEIWCEAPVDVVRARFATRARHPSHDDEARLAEWERFADDAVPISKFETLRVDTSRVVDIETLVAEIRQRLSLDDSRPAT